MDETVLIGEIAHVCTLWSINYWVYATERAHKSFWNSSRSFSSVDFLKLAHQHLPSIN